MKPVNNIYTPVSHNENATTSHINTFSKDIHSVTNCELSTFSIKPKRKPTVSFSFDDKYSKKHSEEEVFVEGKHIMNMCQSLQDEKTDKPQPSSGHKMKMSLHKVIGLGLGLSTLGGLGTGSYFLYRNSHSTTDQGAMLNSSLSTLQPSFSGRSPLLLQKEGYSVISESRSEKVIQVQKLEMNLPPTPDSTLVEFDSNRTIVGYSDQFLINEWVAWAEKTPPNTEERRDIAVKQLRKCISAFMCYLDLSHLHLTSLPASWPPKMISLKISHNQIIKPPENLPSNLRSLEIDHNPFTQIPKLPIRLAMLHISDSQYRNFTNENLPVGFNSLELRVDDDKPRYILKNESSVLEELK